MGPADLTGMTAGETLLDYSRAPYQRRSFSRESKACVFVKPSRRIKTRKGCEIIGLKTSLVQKRLGGVHEQTANTSPTECICNDEPTQMSITGRQLRIAPVNCQRAQERPIPVNPEKAIASKIITVEVGGHLTGNLGFKYRSKAPFACVVDGMGAHNVTDYPRSPAVLDYYSHWPTPLFQNGSLFDGTIRRTIALRRLASPGSKHPRPFLKGSPRREVKSKDL